MSPTGASAGARERARDPLGRIRAAGGQLPLTAQPPGRLVDGVQQQFDPPVGGVTVGPVGGPGGVQLLLQPVGPGLLLGLPVPRIVQLRLSAVVGDPQHLELAARPLLGRRRRRPARPATPIPARGAGS